MKQVELFFWYLPPGPWKPNGKPRLSRWKMTAEEAEKRHPGATPQLISREVREIPETGEDHQRRWRELDTAQVGKPKAPRPGES